MTRKFYRCGVYECFLNLSTQLHVPILYNRRFEAFKMIAPISYFACAFRSRNTLPITSAKALDSGLYQ